MIYCIKIMARQPPLSSKGMSKGLSMSISIPHPRRLRLALTRSPPLSALSLSRLSATEYRSSRASAPPGAPRRWRCTRRARAASRTKAKRAQPCGCASSIRSMCVYRISTYCSYLHAHTAALRYTLDTRQTPGVACSLPKCHR